MGETKATNGKVEVKTYAVMTCDDNMRWTVGRFFDRAAADEVAAVFRRLVARRVNGLHEDVVIEEDHATQPLGRVEYEAHLAAGATFQIKE